MNRYVQSTVMSCSILAGVIFLATSLSALAGPSAWTDSMAPGSISATKTYSLKDDFYVAVNQQKLAVMTIPEGETNYGTFSEVEKANSARLIEVMKNGKGTSKDEQLLHTYYGLLSDWDARNAQGVNPVVPYMNEIKNISSLTEMTAYLTSPGKNPDAIGLIGFGPSLPMSNPDTYELTFTEGNLFLPDAADYKEMSEMGKIYKQSSTDVSLYMLQRFGFTKEQAQAMVDNCFKLEAMMADKMYTGADKGSIDFLSRLDNMMSLADVQAKCGMYPISAIVNAYGAKQTGMCSVQNPEYFSTLAAIYNKQNLPLIKDYLMVKLAYEVKEKVDRAAYEETTKIENEAMGVSGMKADDEYYLSRAKENLGKVVDNVFIRNFATAKMKKDVLGIIKETTDFYREMIKSEDWMSAETKAAAINKLDKMQINAVFPDKLRYYGDLDITPASAGGTLYAADAQLSNYFMREALNRIGTKQNRSEWDYSEVYEVNSNYDPQDNSINIFPGILGGAFYREDMTREEMLAGIGMVIGHEISHAFDSQGSQFDATGAMADWWTEADKKAFDEKVNKLIAYYDNIKVNDLCGNCDGEFLSAEAIADLASIKCMLSIAKEDPNFDYDKFFRTYAGVWLRVMTPENELWRMTQDNHPLSYLRVNLTVAQFDEFIKTYGITPSDGMYIAPADRITVW